MTDDAVKSGRIVGEGTCPNCGCAAKVKQNRKGHLYVYCDQPYDGGCGSGIQSRTDKGDVLIARRVTKWRDAALREKYLGLLKTTDPTPQPAPEPEKKPAPKPPARATAKPAPEPKPAPKPVAWWDKEIL